MPFSQITNPLSLALINEHIRRSYGGTFMGSEFTYKIIARKEEGYIHVEAHGHINLDDLQRMYSSVLKSPQYESCMSRLWDFMCLDASSLTTDDLKTMLKYMKHEDIGTDYAYSAVLVSKDFMYGMIRMLQTIGDEVLSPNILVTKDRDEALTWVTKKGRNFAST
jgi:hypothetical protein